MDLKDDEVDISGKKVKIDNELEIVRLEQFTASSHVSGYHVYRDSWQPSTGDLLTAVIEPDNDYDKYAVCVKEGDRIVGHIETGKTGRFAKTIHYFLRADEYAQCDVLVTGKQVNLGDRKGLKIPCQLHLVGRHEFLEILRKQVDILNRK